MSANNMILTLGTRGPEFRTKIVDFDWYSALGDTESPICRRELWEKFKDVEAVGSYSEAFAIDSAIYDSTFIEYGSDELCLSATFAELGNV